MRLSWDEDRRSTSRSPSLPNRTGGSPASGFPVGSSRWAGSGFGSEMFGRNLPAAQSLRTRSPSHGRPTPANKLRPSGFPPRRRDQPCGTTSALARWPWSGCQHCFPTPLGSMVITHFFATTGALTPADPFVITCRGSLIHITRTSHHSVSNHLRFSARRDPLPQRWPHYFVRASPCARWLARTADRIEFTLSVHSNGPCYGLVVHFQLLSTRGYRPDAVTFSYWPYNVGQVRDFHPAVPVRSQAHERRRLAGETPALPGLRSHFRSSRLALFWNSTQEHLVRSAV